MSQAQVKARVSATLCLGEARKIHSCRDLARAGTGPRAAPFWSVWLTNPLRCTSAARGREARSVNATSPPEPVRRTHYYGTRPKRSTSDGVSALTYIAGLGGRSPPLPVPSGLSWVKIGSFVGWVEAGSLGDFLAEFDDRPVQALGVGVEFEFASEPDRSQIIPLPDRHHPRRSHDARCHPSSYCGCEDVGDRPGDLSA